MQKTKLGTIVIGEEYSEVSYTNNYSVQVCCFAIDKDTTQEKVVYIYLDGPLKDKFYVCSKYKFLSSFKPTKEDKPNEVANTIPDKTWGYISKSIHL